MGLSSAGHIQLLQVEVEDVWEISVFALTFGSEKERLFGETKKTGRLRSPTFQFEVSHGAYPQLVPTSTSSPTGMESGAAVRRWTSPKAALKGKRGTQQRFRRVKIAGICQNRRGGWMDMWKFFFTKLSHQKYPKMASSAIHLKDSA